MSSSCLNVAAKPPRGRGPQVRMLALSSKCGTAGSNGLNSQGRWSFRRFRFKMDAQMPVPGSLLASEMHEHGAMSARMAFQAPCGLCFPDASWEAGRNAEATPIRRAQKYRVSAEKLQGSAKKWAAGGEGGAGVWETMEGPRWVRPPGGPGPGWTGGGGSCRRAPPETLTEVRRDHLTPPRRSVRSLCHRLPPVHASAPVPQHPW